MNGSHIDILEHAVRVRDLEIPSRDVATYLGRLPAEEREPAFVRAVELGVLCFERATTSHDTEFVKRQVDALVKQVETAVGEIPKKVETQLAAKIGTGEGQVLAPVHRLVNEVSRVTGEKVKEVKDLLAQEIDPAKETTTLGRALRTLQTLLDPKRTDSIQSSLQSALDTITKQDGALAKAVKEVVIEAIRPLKEEVDALAKEVRGEEAAAAALEQTTAKGATFEEEVVDALQPWAKLEGAEIHHVGTDNRPGDIVVKLPTPISAAPSVIVIEARDRQQPVGRKTVSDCVSEAMAERAANGAVYLSRNREGLRREIGEWAEGETDRGPWVATTPELLPFAVRVVTIKQRVAALAASPAKIEVGSIAAQLQRIRTTLGRVTNINTKVGKTKELADDIQREAEALREEVRNALGLIEDTIRAAAPKASAVEAA